MASEIELKFEVTNYAEIVANLLKLAKFVNSSYEITMMYDQGKKLFEKDARLRLRKISKLNSEEESTELSYKKPITREGIKIEEEYESEVSNFEEIKKILENLGFSLVSSYERIRDTFYYEKIKITLDSFPFGDYIEFEGEIEQIKRISKECGFNLKENITKSCDDIYAELCLKESKPILDHILFGNKGDLEKQIEKRKTKLLK